MGEHGAKGFATIVLIGNSHQVYEEDLRALAE